MKTYYYIEYILYKLEKTNIVFKYYQPINLKLYQPTFYYLKFHAISHFVQYIQDYNSAVSYNILYNKIANKYFLKAFQNKINKKEYNLQIWQHNVSYTNIIVIKDMIILKRIREKKEILKSIADKTVPIKLT